MNSKMTLGQAIRSRRKEIGITIKELGNELGLSEQAISQYELDKRVPDESILARIAVALKTSALTLLANAGKDEKEIKSFYDTAIAFSKNVDKENTNEAIKSNPKDYYLEQYIYSLGYEIIFDEENGYLMLKSEEGTYEIDMKDIEELRSNTQSFVEYKFHEIIKRSRKIGN